MNSARYAIEVQDLGKTYRRWAGPWSRALEVLTRGRCVGHRDMRALEGVSFQLPRGGSLGLVGLNGAGKSTLLKLLSSTTAPTAGRYRTSGRVASLLELGAGFHPGFSARENAFQNAEVRLVWQINPIHIETNLITIEFYQVYGASINIDLQTSRTTLDRQRSVSWSVFITRLNPKFPQTHKDIFLLGREISHDECK